jgi:L-cystine uptake protein TcyP (sodium:dicarboxylate symporter family)
MNRLIFFILILIPFAVLGLYLGSFEGEKFDSIRKIFLIFLAIYIFIINIIRQKSLNYSWKKILFSLIPFIGAFDRYKHLKEK